MGDKGIALCELRADMGKAVFINLFSSGRSHEAIGCKPEKRAGIELGACNALFVLVDAYDFGFVNATHAEATLEGRFVDYHPVVHIVACVGNHGHNGVHAVRVIV